MKKIFENRWIRGAVPALLIHVCIGTVYCWSLLKSDIATEMDAGVESIESAFSLAIFFLGMSAAFLGGYIENNVRKSAAFSCLMFCCGLIGSVWAIRLSSVSMLFLFYGCVMGIGLGVGYLSPVKTLMLWFSDRKGLATGISISGFGLAKAVFSPFIMWCSSRFGVCATLSAMSGISLLCMGTASFLIRKPETEKIKNNCFSGNLKIFRDRTFKGIWTVFFINITCGLALISFEKDMMLSAGVGCVSLMSSMTAVSNTLGRFGYSAVSDHVGKKHLIYMMIFGTSAAACVLGLLPGAVPACVLMLVVNAGYGGGFSTLPNLLQSKFGMENISSVHGLALSAWAFAGLCGNQISSLVVNVLGLGWNVLFMILLGLYSLSGWITWRCVK